jgi:acyl carrier protein
VTRIGFVHETRDTGTHREDRKAGSMMQSIQAQIRAFIVDNFLFGDSGNGLAETDSFLEKGIIDSTGVLELVSFIEDTYGFRIEDEELVPENLDTIGDVASFVLRKRNEGLGDLTGAGKSLP